MKGYKLIRPVSFRVIQGGTFIDIINTVCQAHKVCSDDLRFAWTNRGMNIYLKMAPE